jgi:hypothetical protein
MSQNIILRMIYVKYEMLQSETYGFIPKYAGLQYVLCKNQAQYSVWCNKQTKKQFTLLSGWHHNVTFQD